ncbi:IS1 family transposase [Klebsiella pneumoniae]
MAHVFGERTWPHWSALSLLSAFEVVVWMTDGWPLYESRLKGKLHVIRSVTLSAFERYNLNRDNIWQGWTEVTVVLKIGGAA